jgi:hypothetical protein
MLPGTHVVYRVLDTRYTEYRVRVYFRVPSVTVTILANPGTEQDRTDTEL